MTYYQEDIFGPEIFPEEDYSTLRRNNSLTSSSQVVIPYKPADEPAWCRHNPTLPPKPKRFKKLTTWDARCSQIQSVVKWTIVAAGAATVATPVLMRLPH